MEINKIRKLSGHKKGRIFLNTSYSYELLLILLYKNQVQSIEDLYNQITSRKPKIAAFHNYILTLVDNNIIKKIQSKDKRKIRLELDPLIQEDFKSNIFN